ncbi:MAG: sugar transferase [Ruminococcaceae bacterium]|nr:sugar transferase [Oscillospiraceae bacterium]
MYAKFFKRFFDFILSLIALTVLFPFLVIFTIVGAIVMKGNPFFTQLRPGKNEKIFKLIKFRTMTCEKDENGKLLPDAQRLTKYGKLLRSTSIDELPELINILKGDMSIIGPRPLVVSYLPYYNEQEKHRHDVRPGLTGLAQINGRNNLAWEERFAYDLKYIENITLLGDIKIIFQTVAAVFKRKDITVRKSDGSSDFSKYREKQLEEAKELTNVGK